MKTFKGYQPIGEPEFQLDSPDEQKHLVVKCVPFISGSKFLDFLTLINAESPGQMAEALDGIFKEAIVGEQYDMFKAWIEDPANGVTIEILGEISGYLSEVYSGRPTQPSLVSVDS
jgi:hypothetical protein